MWVPPVGENLVTLTSQRKSYRSKILLNVASVFVLNAAAVEGRFEAMKSTLQRNLILVDFIRWGILAQDLVPVQQWNETLRELYTEFATSNDLRAIAEFMEDMKQLVRTWCEKILRTDLTLCFK